MAEHQPVLPGTESVQQPRRRRGGRPRADAELALSEHIRARATKKERARLDAQARALGLQPSVYIRQRLFSDEVPAVAS